MKATRNLFQNKSILLMLREIARYYRQEEWELSSLSWKHVACWLTPCERTLSRITQVTIVWNWYNMMDEIRAKKPRLYWSYIMLLLIYLNRYEFISPNRSGNTCIFSARFVLNYSSIGSFVWDPILIPPLVKMLPLSPTLHYFCYLFPHK